MTDKLSKLGDIHIQAGDGNTFGNIGHTVNVTSQIQWVLGDKLRDYIRDQLPKDKLSVVWFSTGSQPSLQLAQQIYQFMKANGFKVFGEGPAAQLYLEPLFDVLISPKDDLTNIYVGLPRTS